jgi:hypothetical protein
MQDGASLFRATPPLPRTSLPRPSATSLAQGRLPGLSEECIAHLEQMTSAEVGRTPGRQVRFIRGLAVFLGR